MQTVAASELPSLWSAMGLCMQGNCATPRAWSPELSGKMKSTTSRPRPSVGVMFAQHDASCVSLQGFQERERVGSSETGSSLGRRVYFSRNLRPLACLCSGASPAVQQLPQRLVCAVIHSAELRAHENHVDVSSATSVMPFPDRSSWTKILVASHELHDEKSFPVTWCSSIP